MSGVPQSFISLVDLMPSAHGRPLRSLAELLKKSSRETLLRVAHGYGCDTIGDFLEVADHALPGRPFRRLRKEVKDAVLYLEARPSPAGGNGAAAADFEGPGHSAPARPWPTDGGLEAARTASPAADPRNPQTVLAIFRKLNVRWFLDAGINRLNGWGFTRMTFGGQDGQPIEELLESEFATLHPRFRLFAREALLSAADEVLPVLLSEPKLLEEARGVTGEERSLLIEPLLELRAKYREQDAPFFSVEGSLSLDRGSVPRFSVRPSGFLAPFEFELGFDPVGPVRQQSPGRSPHDAAACYALAIMDACLYELLGDESLRQKLVSLLSQPAWLRPFQRLEEELPSASSSAEEAELWWYWGADLPQPVLRKRGKRGQWLKPSRLSSNRVGRGEVASATDADVRIAQLLETVSRTQRDPSIGAVLVQTVQDLMVGHPRICVDDAFTPARCYPAKLRVELVPGKEAFEPTVVIGEHRLTVGEAEEWLGSNWHQFQGREVVRTDGELILVDVTPEAGFLFSELLRRPPPLEARSELVRRLPRWSERLPIRMPTGPRVDADARLQVRLTPAGSGLEVGVRVRPMADGPTFAVGAGPSSLYREGADGEIEEVVRDFEAEKAAVGELLDAIDPQARIDRERGEGVLAEPHKALPIVEALQQRRDLDVVWPKGAWSVRTARAAQVSLRIQRYVGEFGLDGVLDVDGRRVLLAQLLEAVRSESSYVRLQDDEWVRLDESLRSLVTDLESASRAPARKKKGAPPRLVTSFGAPAVDRALAAAGEVEADTAWAELLARIEKTRRLEPRVPAKLGVELRPYQEQGFRWMSRLAAWGAGACLADDMGLGKTIQALALLASRAKTGPQLVVAPTSVVPNWLAELERGSPQLKRVRYEGPARAELVGSLGERNTVVVTSYAVLARDAEVLADRRWSTVVLDEAQAVKNAASIRSKAVRDLQADFRLALTGTPIENDLGELWALFEFLVPGLLGDERTFRACFKETSDPDLDVARSASLARLVEPFILRRTKRDVAPELPPRTELVRAVELSKREKELYAAVWQAAVDHVRSLDVVTDAGTARFRILAWMTRLRQLACHPRLYDPRSRVASSKHEALLELVRELESEGRRALVFSQFVKQLDLVQSAFEAEGISFERLDGKTPRVERERRVAAFMSGSASVFLVSLKAGGTGLNLTAADTVVHLDPWWNPAVEDQATDRVHRIGQTQPVTVVRLVSQGTIEERILEMHDRKRALADRVLLGADAAGRLDTRELAALITGASSS